MGVYHLMGLGRSPGTVTGPLSYLAHRYQRWDENDQKFFSGSGEWKQRALAEKVGDVQAIVLFTTAEVIRASDANGKSFLTLSYVKNQLGKTTGAENPSVEMSKALEQLLPDALIPICGNRENVSVFWCEIDRRDIQNVFSRVIQVTDALRNVGALGKEIWANLTGGNNVTNSALELAAYLSGDISRLYYVQAHDQAAEKCAFYTAEEGYWVDLPVMPLAIGRLRKAIINMLLTGAMQLGEIYSRLRNEYWDLARGLDNEAILLDEHLKAMERQGLIRDMGNKYIIGSQWELIEPYLKTLDQARETHRTIEQLARDENWITYQEIKIR